VPLRSRRLRLAGRIALLILLVLVLGPILYVFFTPDTRPRLTLPPVPGPGPYRVYAVDWGHHVSIVVEQPAGWRLGPPGREDASFLDYGWGDKSYFMESDYRLHVLFATVFLPTASVVYLEGRRSPPRVSGGAHAVFVRSVDAATLRTLLTMLEGSIVHSSSGTRAAPYPPVPRTAGRFYPAYGDYFLAGACNWWTVRRLREAGLAGDAKGVFFSRQVAGRLRGFAPDDK
jgi:hypothetical protein